MLAAAGRLWEALTPELEYLEPVPFVWKANGAAPRNPVAGPGVTTFDLTVSKSFCVREGHSVLFRTEFFNAFNTRSSAIPEGRWELVCSV